MEKGDEKVLSTAELIKDYVNKKSRKVGQSRTLLKMRWNKLDREEKMAVMDAFFKGSATDRCLMCCMLYEGWDEQFMEPVRVLWEKFHDTEAGWLVIQFLPEDYVMAHLKELTVGRNYFFICKRLMHREDFHVDKELLSTVDYLNLLILKGEGMDDREALEIVVKEVAVLCFGDYYSTCFPTKRGGRRCCRR